MLRPLKIIEELKSFGFESRSKNSKTEQYDKGNLTVFVKRRTMRFPLVIHPEQQVRFEQLCQVEGAHTDVPLKFYHNATMRAFPSRVNTGKQATKYGIAFGFDSEGSLRSFLRVLEDPAADILSDLSEIDSSGVDQSEKLSLRKARIGQGQFRDRLIEEFNGTCPLTKINQPELLRASHIRPWAKSETKERLDPQNGLLLAASADALFDAGFISFDCEGLILISKSLRQETLSALGLHDQMSIGSVTARRDEYLEYHRGQVFLG